MVTRARSRLTAKPDKWLPVPIALEYSGDNSCHGWNCRLCLRRGMRDYCKYSRLRDGGQSQRKIATRPEVLDALVASAQTSAIAHGVQANLSRWRPCQKVPRADNVGLRLLYRYRLGNGLPLSVSPG